MNLLALELSTRMASLALFVDGEAVASRSWDEETGRNEHALEVLPILLTEAGLDLPRLDLIAVGRGPGNYSGMRVALSIAHGLALPGKTQRFAVSSGEALAQATAVAHGVSPVAVVGDARRGKLWYGLFDADDNRVHACATWQLLDTDALAAVIPDDALVVTPEWARLGARIQESALDAKRWLREDTFPTARAVGTVAMQRLVAGSPSDPLTPIYLHDAV